MFISLDEVTTIAKYGCMHGGSGFSLTSNKDFCGLM